MSAGFIPPHGGYEKLHSYQKSLIVFLATYYLAKRWVRMGSRTRDQMEQSARSGKQNIVEGSLASATSKQTEIHLTNVARASIGELLEDYKDFLRLRRLSVWDKSDPRMLAMRALGQAFLKEGGIRERMTQARLAARDPQSVPPTDSPAPPDCPLCNKPMRKRTARQGRNAGQPFWGCPAYPDCKGTRPA
jgi:four helix bundle protein